MKEIIRMFRLFLLLPLLLECILASETLLIGNNNAYDTLSYQQYSPVKDMNESVKFLNKNIWNKNKFDIKFDQGEQAYWVHFKVQNIDNNRKELYLIDERRYIYSFEYYLVKDNKIVLYKKDGFYVQDNISSFHASQRVLPISLEANEKADIFFKVQNYNMLDMPFKLVTKDYLIEYFQLYSFLQGAFFIVLIVMVIYNVIIYFIVRVRVYLYYLGYVSLLILYQAAYFGYLKLLGIPPLVLLVLMVSGGIGFVIFAALFIKELFQLKKYLPTIDKIFFFIVCYLLCVMIINIGALMVQDFILAQIMFNMISFVMPLYVSILLYALYYLAYKKVNKIVYIYSFVWTIIAFLGLFLIAMHSNIISTDLGIDYLFQVGMLIETILFSLLLAYRIKEIQLEKQEQQLILIQQNRLASMGEMISTIAHQWRQPLSQINGQVLGLDMDYKNKKLTDSRMESYLSDIEQTTESMSETINDFMNFFNTKKKLEEFWISDVIDEASRIVTKSLSEKGKIHKPTNDVLIQGFKSELVQAMLIIINNGIDASKNQTLTTIEVSVEEIEEEKIEICVKDYGHGISNEVLAHIFEPYYTTKHKSQGTGLGLYILKMIIENGMGGMVHISNHLNGVIVKMTIPKRL